MEDYLYGIGGGLALIYGGIASILEDGVTWWRLILIIAGIFLFLFPFLSRRSEKRSEREAERRKHERDNEEMHRAAERQARFEKLKEHYKNEM